MASKQVDFERIIKHEIEGYELEGYKIISKSVYDPAHSIFSTDRNKKSSVRVVFCNACDTCEAYKKGECLRATTIFTQNYCPFSRVYTMEGFTRRSKEYIRFIREAKSALGIDDKYFLTRLDPVRQTVKIGDGSKIHISLPHLDNYVNPCYKELKISTRANLIDTKNFTEEVVRFLLEFKPVALMGDVIESYQEQEIPRFIRNLKINFPELYKSVIKGTDYEKRIYQMKTIGKRAMLSTLQSGKVKYQGKIWDWDGKTLTGESTPDMESITMTPKPNVVVTIVDEDTVNDDTIIKD